MTLKELRLQSGKTAQEVARELGVSVRAIYNYEKGIRSIGLAQVLFLARVLDVSSEEVIHAQLSSCRCAQSDSQTLLQRNRIAL